MSETVLNDMLEHLSDKVRKGEPVSFLEAIAVINYQEQLRHERDARSIVGRVKRWLYRKPPAPEPTP